MSDADVIAALTDQIQITRQRATEAERIADELREELARSKFRESQLSTSTCQWRERYHRIDEPRMLKAMGAAQKRNETIVRLAAECAELHGVVRDLRALAKSQATDLWRSQLAIKRAGFKTYAAERIANEAMRVGLEMCEELRTAMKDIAQAAKDDHTRQDYRILHLEKLAKEAIGLKITLDSMMGERDEALRKLDAATSAVQAWAESVESLKAELSAATKFEFGNFFAEKVDADHVGPSVRPWEVLDRKGSSARFIGGHISREAAIACAKDYHEQFDEKKAPR